MNIMNIIKARQEERRMKIQQMINTLHRAHNEGLEIDEKKLINQCCLEWGMSNRVIKEYLKIAKFQLENG